jgi:DNA-directed RNA polymerase subunit RPC12/RpoP
VPLRQQIDCPQCGARLVRKRGGRCSTCGAEVARHIEDARRREERIERTVAVIGTGLVLVVSALTAGFSLVEGVLAYAGVGAVVFLLAKRTFR